MRSRILAWLLAAALAAPPVLAETFRRANGNEPDTLDPQKYQLISENNVLRDLFEGLTTQDKDNRVVAGQAERWETSPDGLTWTFHLRAGLKWSDGTPLTADDFVAGMRRAVDPRTGAQIVDLAYKLKNARAILKGEMPVEQLGVAAPDPATVVITLETRSPLILALMSTTVMVPVPRHVIAKVGNDWVKPEHMVTNGAYLLVRWTPSSAVEVTRNPNFRAADTVGIETVTYLPSDDQEASLKQFRAGEVDFVPAIPAAKIDWARRALADAIHETPVDQTRYLAINHQRALLKDVRVRRALALAIDRETIAERIMQKGAIPAYGLIPRTIEGYQGSQMDFAGQSQAQRVAAAKALLAEAGYGPGNPLTFEFRTLSDSWAKPVATAITSMWQAIGVKVNLKAAEAKSHFAALDAGDYDVAVSGWFGTDDPETFMWLFQQDGGINESHYANPAFDLVRAEAEQTMDTAQRYRRYADAEKILMDDIATIPLFWTVQAVLISPKVQGFAATPRGFTRSRYASLGR